MSDEEIAGLTDLLSDAEWFIESEGYRRCDVAACNCPYWHGGHAMTRLTEIQEVLEDSGCEWKGTTIATLKAALSNVSEQGNE